MKKQPTLEEIAKSLSEIRNEKKVFDDLDKRLATKLLKGMKKAGVSKVGDFKIAERATLDVSPRHEQMMRDFAEANFAMKVDSAKLVKIIKPLLKQPAWFKLKRTEYLRGRTEKGDE